MNKHILNPEVQQFIKQNLQTDPAKIALKKSPFSEVSSAELAQQIAGKNTAAKKLPLWFNTPGIYYPTKLALEQCSSALTATYKSQLIKGQTLLDLSGGLGVDTVYFAKKVYQVTHLEKQAELSEIARHNAQALGLKNIKFEVTDAENYLKNQSSPFDNIYLDPSRRISGKKVFKLADCEPNIVALQAKLLELSPRILLKAAPLLDIRSALNEIQQVSDIYVISVNNEVKELLFMLQKEFKEAEPSIHCISLSTLKEQHYSFKLSEEKSYEPKAYGEIDQYIYEPDSAWLKAGCFKLISRDFPVDKLHQHTHLYTSKDLISDFPGRKFKVKQIWTYTDFNKQQPIKQANVLSRNFPLNPTELVKKHKIKDGGETYLLFCTDKNNQLKVIEAQKA